MFILDSTHIQDIYKFTRMSIDHNAALTRYEVPRGKFLLARDNHITFFLAGLALISRHAALFGEYLAKDSQVTQQFFC